MNLQNKLLRNKGFTVVELLVVIVVIAVLASIMLVSYTGVQNQSKSEAAKANAASVKKVAEAYYNARNAYPTQVAHFITTFSTMPSNILLITSGALTEANGKESILYRTTASANGACIMYWDYAPLSGSAGIVVFALLGNATSGTCNATTGTLPT